jgi:hypothetical protein
LSAAAEQTALVAVESLATAPSFEEGNTRTIIAKGFCTI